MKELGLVIILKTDSTPDCEMSKINTPRVWIFHIAGKIRKLAKSQAFFFLLPSQSDLIYRILLGSGVSYDGSYWFIREH